MSLVCELKKLICFYISLWLCFSFYYINSVFNKTTHETNFKKPVILKANFKITHEKVLLRNVMKTIDFALLHILNDWL